MLAKSDCKLATLDCNWAKKANMRAMWVSMREKWDCNWAMLDYRMAMQHCKKARLASNQVNLADKWATSASTRAT